jgi:hypothetical protein
MSFRPFVSLWLSLLIDYLIDFSCSLAPVLNRCANLLAVNSNCIYSRCWVVVKTFVGVMNSTIDFESTATVENILVWLINLN